MQSRSLSRELALLLLGQVSDQSKSADRHPAMENLLQKALDSLMQHWRESLDGSEPPNIQKIWCRLQTIAWV